MGRSGAVYAEFPTHGVCEVGVKEESERESCARRARMLLAVTKMQDAPVRIATLVLVLVVVLVLNCFEYEYEYEDDYEE